MLEEALTARVLEHPDAPAALAEFEGSLALHWVDRPQGAPLPALVLQFISRPRDQHRKDFQDLQFARLQAAALGTTYAEARAVVDLVIAALVPRALNIGGIYFRRASVNGPRDLGERAAEGFVHRQVLDLIIRHSPAA